MCYFDGATEPVNPGGAMGTGSLIKVNGEVIYSESKYYPPNPKNTNNCAEYIAFGLILRFLLDNKLDTEEVTIVGDSQLVIKQMTGEYAIKSGAYTKYAVRCKELLSAFSKKPVIYWIKRDQNSEADDLSKAKLFENNIEIKATSKDISILSFGKYAGKSIYELEDLSYLKWALSAVKMKNNVRSIIKRRVSQMEFEAR